MDSRDESARVREVEPVYDADISEAEDGLVQHETHATTGGAAAAGAVTGAVVGLAGGPAGAAVGAIGGAIVGVAAERIMHHDDDDHDHTSIEEPAPIQDRAANT